MAKMLSICGIRQFSQLLLLLSLPSCFLASDLKCNSERLRRVIQSATGRDTTAVKRSIQLLAEQRLSDKYNVICAEQDFSYITNTEEYCQEVVEGKTCYVFKQFSRAKSESGKRKNPNGRLREHRVLKRRRL